MSVIRKCFEIDCYDNHNLKHICLRSSVTLDSTGTCENIEHCDQYECDSCQRFKICTKLKKEEFGRSQLKQNKVGNSAVS